MWYDSADLGSYTPSSSLSPPSCPRALGPAHEVRGRYRTSFAAHAVWYASLPCRVVEATPLSVGPSCVGTVVTVGGFG